LYNLREFLKAPAVAESNGLCCPGASDAWWLLSEDDRTKITSSMSSLLEAHPRLPGQIKKLKSESSLHYAHGIFSSKEELERFFASQGDVDFADAVKDCYEWTMMTNPQALESRLRLG
jgi:hypothetical protein